MIHLPGQAKICMACESRHIEALQAISSGQYAGECSECYRKLDGPDVRAAIHFEDGKYRMMCLPCDAVYVPKRRDLYGETEFGRELKLN